MSVPKESTVLSLKNANFFDEINKLVQDLTSNKITLADIVAKLEIYFFSREVQNRIEGLKILAILLCKTPCHLLNKDVVYHFCMFYKAKLRDNPLVYFTVFNSIYVLSLFETPMEEGCFSEVLDTTFKYVSCQSQEAVVRLKIYQIFQNLLKFQVKEIMSMGERFINGVITAFDGEANSTNLLFLFTWLPEFINCPSLKMNDFYETIFECLSCYFPIDLRSPEKKANREQLAVKLKYCLCATEEFADLTIKLMIEKLESDVHIAKMDSLQLLIHCFDTFDFKHFENYMAVIWKALERELLNCFSQELEDVLVTAITQVAKKHSIHKSFIPYFEDMLSSNHRNFKNEIFFEPTYKLYLAISKANEVCARKVRDDVVTFLMKLFLLEIERRHSVFRAYIQFIEVCDNYHCVDSVVSGFITPKVFDNDPELQKLSLQALCYMPNHLNTIPKEVIEIWRKLFTIELREDVQPYFFNCLLHYTSKYFKEISGIIELFGLVDFKMVMYNLCHLSSREPYIQHFCTIVNVCYHAHSEQMLEYLNKALTLHENNEDLYRTLDNMQVINTHIMNHELIISESQMQNVRDILLKVMAYYNAKQQMAFLNKHSKIILQDCKPQSKLVYYLSGIMINLYVENLEGFSSMLNGLFTFPKLHESQMSIELLANVINKLPEEQTSDLVNYIHKALIRGLSNGQGEQMGIMLLWVTKALYMKGNPGKSQYLKLIIDYIQNTECASRNLHIIMRNYPCLSEKSHAKRTIFYKQQFFEEICKKLQFLHQSYTPGSDMKYMQAFAFLLKETPIAILQLYFAKTIKLIFTCLDNFIVAGLTAILETIKNLIQNKDELIQTYLEELLSRLLKLSTFPDSMEVRILAIQCLRLYVDAHKHYDLFKHKAEIITTLAHCLNDKKRLVRKEAAETRLSWFLFDLQDEIADNPTRTQITLISNKR